MEPFIWIIQKSHSEVWKKTKNGHVCKLSGENTLFHELHKKVKIIGFIWWTMPFSRSPNFHFGIAHCQCIFSWNPKKVKIVGFIWWTMPFSRSPNRWFYMVNMQYTSLRHCVFFSEYLKTLKHLFWIFQKTMLNGDRAPKFLTLHFLDGRKY